MGRLQGRKLFATHVQIDEIRKTPDEARRNELLAMFEEGKRAAEALLTEPTLLRV
jgi:hypothetical protein